MKRAILLVIAGLCLGFLTTDAAGRQAALLWSEGAPGMEQVPDSEKVVNRDVDQGERDDPAALMDARRAIRMVRSRAETLGITDDDATPRVILAIGDSNGASEEGWVHQLQQLRPRDTIINKSVSGNTIGFDNLDQEGLNTLKNIDRYLEEAMQAAGGRAIDDILIALGTNDSKAVFDERSGEVPANLQQLIRHIRAHPLGGQRPPHITIVTPPPYGPDSLLQAKYVGGDARVQALVPLFKDVADAEGCRFVDIYHPLKPRFRELSPDGVHLVAEGQRLIAERINRSLNSSRAY